MYCLSRDNTETVAAQIREQTDVSAAHYHAGGSWWAGLSLFVVVVVVRACVCVRV